MRENVAEFEVRHTAKVATLVLAAIASADKLACATWLAACGHTGTLRMPSHMCGVRRQSIDSRVLEDEVRGVSRVEKERRSGTSSLGDVVKGRFWQCCMHWSLSQSSLPMWWREDAASRNGRPVCSSL